MQRIAKIQKGEKLHYICSFFVDFILQNGKTFLTYEDSMDSGIVFKINSDSMKVGELFANGTMSPCMGNYLCTDKPLLSHNICIMDLLGRVNKAVVFTYIDYGFEKNCYHKILPGLCQKFANDGIPSIKKICQFLQRRVIGGLIDLYIVQLDLDALPARRVSSLNFSDFYQ